MKKFDEGSGGTDGQCAEHQSINEAKDCGICASAKRQDSDHDNGETGMLTESAECKSHILPECFNNGFPSCRTYGVPGNLQTASFQANFPQGIIMTQPMLHFLLCRYIEKRTQLLVHFA